MAEKSMLGRIVDSPAVGKFTDSVTDNLTARVSNIGQPKSNSNSESESTDSENGPGLMDRMKSGAKGGAIKGALKGAVKAIKPGGKKNKRPTNIVEDVLVGVDLETCWNEWLEFDEFSGYMKGPQSINSDEDDQGRLIVSWTAKIFLSKRSWKSTVVEQVDYERIRWESEGSKGVVEGAITFTEMGDNATLMIVVIEYRSKGPIEWIGNRWRTVGRRIRLDLKHFKRHVMMLDQSEDDDESDEDDTENDNTEEEQGSTSE